MLHCGTEWRPTLVKRVIELLPTSTRPAKVLTDQGVGFLKGMGNPQGSGALAQELVGTELARWLGLKTPPFAIVNLRDMDIPMLHRPHPMQHGPAFVSGELKGATGDGGAAFLRKLTNPQDVAKLVLFDTWIRNSDRYAPWIQGQEDSNLDNLFFRPEGRKFELVAFDHSHCFVETSLDTELNWQATTRDERIYGNFPSFKPYFTYDSLDAARARLREMNQEIAGEIVGSIPEGWEIPEETRTKWVEVICARAALVDGYIEMSLMGQARMEWR